MRAKDDADYLSEMPSKTLSTTRRSWEIATLNLRLEEVHRERQEERNVIDYTRSHVASEKQRFKKFSRRRQSFTESSREHGSIRITALRRCPTVAPVIAKPRERAGRVKTAQRRRAVLTRPSAPEQSNTGATQPAVTALIDAQTRLASTRSGLRRPAEESVSARGTASAPLATRVRSVERPPIEP